MKCVDRCLKLFQLVLAIGNALNQGGYGGQALGFKISSILKVRNECMT
jgi:hypothetical protein